jgi:hypothetical protein
MPGANVLAVSSLATFLVSVLGSSIVAAFVTAVMARTSERKRQLREQMLQVAGDFAGNAMEVLALLRHYRPTKPMDPGQVHRNEILHSNPELRATRHDDAAKAIDRLRPQRGRVRLVFATEDRGVRAARKAGGGHGPIAEGADQIVSALRTALEASNAYWEQCDKHPGDRDEYDREGTDRYRAARNDARESIDRFCKDAAHVMRSP